MSPGLDVIPTMRTSRISQDTAKVLSATTSTPRRSTRSSLAHFAHNGSKTNGVKAEEPDDYEESKNRLVDIEDIVPQSKKRKRSALSSTSIKPEPASSSSTSKTARKERKPARRITNPDTGEESISPPSDWAEIYNIVKQMRLDPEGPAFNAAVDTMGCATLAQKTASPRDQRFQTLVALMLSSQTKDTVTAVAMQRLQSSLPAAPGQEKGLCLENILAVEPALLNEMIGQVGFHNNKTKYIKAAAEILRDKFAGEIPDTIEGLISLPGVGPKMAYLCMSAAWGRDEGIGVDVHVHRITNLWGWNGNSGKGTKNPEETRMMLQSWLPRELWHEINWLLVGFGQSVCLPVGRRCGDCEVGMKGLCRAADRAKVNAGRARREMEMDVVKAEKDVKVEEGLLKAEAQDENDEMHTKQEETRDSKVKSEELGQDSEQKPLSTNRKENRKPLATRIKQEEL